MRMYPAYKLRDVMEEYAITVFTLINEGRRLQYEHYLVLAQISDLPSMDQKTREKFYKNLEWASTHPDDILSVSDDYSDIEQLRKFLGGNK